MGRRTVNINVQCPLIGSYFREAPESAALLSSHLQPDFHIVHLPFYQDNHSSHSDSGVLRPHKIVPEDPAARWYSKYRTKPIGPVVWWLIIWRKRSKEDGRAPRLGILSLVKCFPSGRNCLLNVGRHLPRVVGFVPVAGCDSKEERAISLPSRIKSLMKLTLPFCSQ